MQAFNVFSMRKNAWLSLPHFNMSRCCYLSQFHALLQILGVLTIIAKNMLILDNSNVLMVILMHW